MLRDETQVQPHSPQAAAGSQLQTQAGTAPAHAHHFPCADAHAQQMHACLRGGGMQCAPVAA
ncbi:hypothetical protein BC834DRAFT_895965 [Gloeopeniophorella convolvens]|nr:hypothetical protein BC834DRAFT_895965 [Gloeopeniophorella convolvens]